MPSIGLWDNWVGPIGTGSNGGFTTEWGLAFTCTTSINVTGLKWYAGVANNAAYAPTNLHLWDGVTHALLDTLAVSTPTTTGWQTYNLPAARNLQANYLYVVSFQWGTNHFLPFVGQQLVLSSPLVWDVVPTRTAGNNGGGLWPGTSLGNQWPAVDVVATVGTVTPPGPAPTTNDNLASWLRADSDNTHQDTSSVPGLPWEIHQDTQSVVAGINVAGGVSGATVGGIAAWVWANRDSLLWAYNQLRSHFAATPDATYPEIDTNVLTLLSRTGTLLSDNTSIMAALTNIQADLAKLLTPPATSAGWTLVDETDFDTNLAWGVAADVYTVSFSDLGSGSVNTVIDTVDVSYRLAWWAPWNGSASRDRRFIDFPGAQLYDGGVRMPGVVIHSPQGAQGHIQAWTIA